MAYSVFGDVRARCDTDITDGELTSLIEESDAWLDLKLDMGDLTVPMRRLLSATLTAVRAMLKDPDAQAIGEYREDRAATLKKLNSMMDEMISDAGGGIAFRYGFADLRWPLV